MRGEEAEKGIVEHFAGRLRPATLPTGAQTVGETKKFLEKHGLPATGPLLLRFRSGALKVRDTPRGRVVVVGDDTGTDLALEEASGALVSIDEATGERVRFVNSGLIAFLDFLRRYEERLPLLKQASDEEGAAIARELRGMFSAIDPAAVEDEDAWWSLVLEQTEQGLL